MVSAATSPGRPHAVLQRTGIGGPDDAGTTLLYYPAGMTSILPSTGTSAQRTTGRPNASEIAVAAAIALLSGGIAAEIGRAHV